VHPIPRRIPGWEELAQARVLGQQILLRDRTHLAADDVAGEAEVHRGRDALLVHGGVGGKAAELVDGAEALGGLAVDEALDGGGEERHLVGVEASLLPAPQHQGQGPRGQAPQDGDAGEAGAVPGAPLRVEALHAPAALPVEEAVEHVAHGGRVDPALGVARHRRQQGLQRGLQVPGPTRGCCGRPPSEDAGVDRQLEEIERVAEHWWALSG